MANDIDELMDLDPVALTKNPAAVDAIIAYHRNNRAIVEGGAKPKKEAHKIDLKALGLVKKTEPIKRRI
jgi:hypothetical protein